ncbi:MAG: DUF692 domain-containing protein [bacterium]|nr:DUF692 domain-containing protein [bacterium]
MKQVLPSGAGLGFRRDIKDYFLSSDSVAPRFVELAPENWMEIGGKWKKILKTVAEKFPITCHGLSLSLGSPEPLDLNFLAGVKKFLQEYNVAVYSEHLSFNKCDNAHLYDLLPIPFCEEAVHHVSERIRIVQDFLERKIAIENVSYYTPVAPQIDEVSFISAIAEESDCNLLLDVNNVYVNAFNHGYDAKGFIDALPLNRVAYIHMAGHEQKSPTLIIDTHGEPIIEPVYDLFDWTLQKVKEVPVLLERDFNFPDPKEIETELLRLQSMIDARWKIANAA